MNPTPEDLEKLLHRALRDLPDRRAPLTLETRVLAEIGRRAERPWWRRSYLHWPAPMRGGFLVLSAAAAAGTVAGLFRLGQGPGTGLWNETVWQRFGWLISVGTDLFRAIPPFWLYGGLAVLVACYAVLIGVAAAAYRTFFKPV